MIAGEAVHQRTLCFPDSLKCFQEIDFLSGLRKFHSSTDNPSPPAQRGVINPSFAPRASVVTVGGAAMQTVFPAQEKLRLRSKEQLSSFPSPLAVIHWSQASPPAAPFPLCTYSCDAWQGVIACFLFSLCFRFVIMMGC